MARAETRDIGQPCVGRAQVAPASVLLKTPAGVSVPRVERAGRGGIDGQGGDVEASLASLRCRVPGRAAVRALEDAGRRRPGVERAGA